MNYREIKINRIAQGIISFEEGFLWFESANKYYQQKILQDLNVFLQHTHPRPNEIETGIQLSGLKTTYTPCVLILKKPIKDALAKIMLLPQDEWKKAFILLMSIFGVADLRRRNTQCKDGCSHAWHDLASL